MTTKPIYLIPATNTDCHALCDPHNLIKPQRPPKPQNQSTSLLQSTPKTMHYVTPTILSNHTNHPDCNGNTEKNKKEIEIIIWKYLTTKPIYLPPATNTDCHALCHPHNLSKPHRPHRPQLCRVKRIKRNRKDSLVMLPTKPNCLTPATNTDCPS